MNERLLEPLICQKYPRNIKNILNLQFGNFRCFTCIWSSYMVGDILVIIWVSRVFIVHFFFFFLSFWGYFHHFFQVFGYSYHFFSFKGILVIFLVFRSIFVIFQVLEVFQSFFRFMEYFGNFLGLGCILVIFRFQGYFGHFFRF